jgi:hypothetical protein
VAGLVVMSAAVPIASAIVLYSGLRQSTWIRIGVRADRPTPPDLQVAYGPGRDEALPVIWEGLAPRTILGIDASAPARLVGIDTDRGVVPPALAQTWASQWRRLADPAGLLVQGPGIVDITGTFQRLTLTFEAGPGLVQVGWLDQQASVDLSAGTAKRHSVTLALPARHRGWVLLPPTAIRQMALRPGAQAGRFSLEEISLQGGTWENWSAQSLSDGVVADAGACQVSVQGGTLLIDASQAGGCDVPIRLLAPLNGVPAATWLSISALLIVSGAVCLHLLAAVAGRVKRFSAAYEIVETSLGRRMREHPTRWTRGRLMLVVLACTALYHISYILSVPIHFNFDSLGYYAFGRNFLHTLDLASIATCRTPGYPGAIALSILIFGDQLHALVAAQHLTLSLLGILVVWFLYPRVGPLWACLAGLLAGTSPLLSIAASIVWTEALFAAFAMTALLVFLYEEEPRPVSLFWAGLFAGVTTLIRPNGAVIVALIVGWLFLKWWCTRGQVSRLLLQTGVVVAGCALVTLVWVVHFHRVTGRWGLSDPNCSLEGQSRPVLAAGLQPTNIFQLAGFTNVISQHDAIGTLPIGRPHEVFFRYFPARHRYHIGRFIPWELIYDDRYPGEIFRQYVRVFRARYARQVFDALVFNLTHVEPPGITIFVYRDLEDVLKLHRSRTYQIPPPADARVEPLLQTSTMTWPEAERLLTQLTESSAPRRSPVRSLHLRLGAAAVSAWKWVTLFGALGGLVCLLLPGYRRFAVLAAHALVLAAAPAVLGMGADRYAMVAEPAWYVLIALLLSTVLRYRLRRAPSAASKEITGHVFPS